MRRRVLSVAVAVASVVVVAGGPARAVQVQQDRLVVANPADVTPQVLDGAVKSIAQVGGTVIIGGTFTQVQEVGAGKAVLTRNRVMAFDAVTGAIRPSFTPSVNAEVTTVLPAPDGTSVYLGGSFTSVDGVSASRVIRLDVATGARTAGFAPPTVGAAVKDLRLVRDQLVLAGPFKAVGGQPRTSLASLSASTGALTGFVNHAFAGARNGGSLQVIKIDVTPDGRRLMGIGNFSTVDGADRPQIVLLDTSGPTSVLADWQTSFYDPMCASVFDTYLRDLDLSPDGRYAVVSTTGAYGGPDGPCDVIARFELDVRGTGLQPTWRDYTGGDTTYAVAVTGAVVYVGGHFRWMNNSFAGDAAGPGAVPREGIAALDPMTGLPFSWNPGRGRGVGVFDLLATSAGLWVGSDTERIGGEIHPRLAFFPLIGGQPLPADRSGTLPNDVYLLGDPVAAADPSVLFRVNAGGPTLLSTDDGPDWVDGTGGPFANTGNSASWDPVPTVDSSVPSAPDDSAPRAIFDSERWDDGDDPEMVWSFLVPAGRPVRVRLYLANRYPGTGGPGQRVFDVQVDGATVLDDLDLAAAYGDQVGHMEYVDVVSDGSVDIGFGHVVENPLVNGIEIIDLGVTPGSGSAGDRARRRFLEASGVTGPTVTVPSATPWGRARGAALVDGTLYTGWSDGTLTARTFDGTAFGAPSTVDLYGGSFGSDVGNVTGLAYADGRLYYTKAGDDRLYWRWFTTQSRVVGTDRFEASGDVGSLAPGRVSGMFAAGGWLYVADRTDGALYRVALAAGTVSGAAQLVDVTADWRSRALFLWNGTPAGPPNQTPVASFTSACAVNVCAFTSTSTDPDGSIVSTSWDFGDGQAGTGVGPSHAYGSAGTYRVRLTVTDNRGDRATTESDVSVADPPNQGPTASFTTSCAALECSFTSTSTDPDGSIVQFDWSFGDGQSSTLSAPRHTYAAGGIYSVTLTVVDEDGAPSAPAAASVTVQPAPASVIAFRASAVARANAVTTRVGVPPSVVTGDAMLLFVSTAGVPAVTTEPSGWSLLGERTDGNPDLRTRVYVRVAQSTDAGSIVTVGFASRVKTDLTVLAYSGTDPVAPVAMTLSRAEPVTTASHSTPGVSITEPGCWLVSYWADKSSSTLGWTAPAGLSVRSLSIGSGSGRVTSMVADNTAAVPVGSAGSLTAVASAPSGKATMWSVVLRAAP